MNPASARFPPPEEGLRLHLRLLALEADATADACQAYLVPLQQSIARKYSQVDPHILQTAVDNALWVYLRNPVAYDPQKKDLAAYLRMSARGDLLNLLRAEQRHHHKRTSWSIVELDENEGNLSGRESEPSVQLERNEEAERHCAILQRLRDGCTPEEQRVLELMLAGERAHGVFAAVLGVMERTPAEQKQEVKRVKDRLKKRLERGGPAND